MGKIKSFNRVCRTCSGLQKEGKKIVFCHGIFDILHRGHVTLLVEAKKLGDVLVVGVDHDDNARILKGPKRPINNNDARMFVLANLEPVNYVFPIGSIKNYEAKQRSEFYLELYKKLKPDIIATSLKAGKFGRVKKEQAKKAGVKFVDINHGVYNKRTTKVINVFGLD